MKIKVLQSNTQCNKLNTDYYSHIAFRTKKDYHTLSIHSAGNQTLDLNMILAMRYLVHLLTTKQGKADPDKVCKEITVSKMTHLHLSMCDIIINIYSAYLL